MPKAKSSKTNSKKASASKKSKKTSSKKAEHVEEPVDAAEVTLVEETVPETAPEPTPEEAPEASPAVDSSGDEATEQNPYDHLISHIETLIEFNNASFAQFHQRHRTSQNGLKELLKLARIVKRKGPKTKRKNTGKKTNTNSGITGQRNISDQMRAFLGEGAAATYSYTTLCGAIMDYGKGVSLVGMKTTDADGKEKIDNRYIQLDAKLKKLFKNYDDVQKEVAAAVVGTDKQPALLKDGKNRWVNRAGVMKLIKPHLLETVPSAEVSDEGAAEGAAEEAAEASS